MTGENPEVQANAMLQHAAARQAIVDRLLSRSVWDGFIRAMTVPVIANVLCLLVLTGWPGHRLVSQEVVLASALSALLWLSLAVAQVARRVRALAAILQNSRVLDEFVAPPVRRPDPAR